MIKKILVCSVAANLAIFAVSTASAQRRNFEGPIYTIGEHREPVPVERVSGQVPAEHAPENDVFKTYDFQIADGTATVTTRCRLEVPPGHRAASPSSNLPAAVVSGTATQHFGYTVVAPGRLRITFAETQPSVAEQTVLRIYSVPTAGVPTDEDLYVTTERCGMPAPSVGAMNHSRYTLVFRPDGQHFELLTPRDAGGPTANIIGQRQPRARRK